MSVGLLDVNALIALLWEEHPFHKRCAEWFAGAAKTGWATCPMTESGCIRILSNTAFTVAPPSVQSALRLLHTATRASSSHRFWADDLLLSAIAAHWRKRLGHKQVTEVYLLSLAIHNNGKLVTFDSRMQSLAPVGSIENDALVILRP